MQSQWFISCRFHLYICSGIELTFTLRFKHSTTLLSCLKVIKLNCTLQRFHFFLTFFSFIFFFIFKCIVCLFLNQIANHPSIYVLDTPGVLVPSIPDIETGLKLALTGLNYFQNLYQLWYVVEFLVLYSNSTSIQKINDKMFSARDLCYYHILYSIS